MDYDTTQYLIWAVVLGAISAVSLPLGSALGLQTKPRPIYISVLAAFGAGALIAALSVELVPIITRWEATIRSGHLVGNVLNKWSFG
jgi:zinc transporter ZupT